MRIFRADVADVPRIVECAREFCALLGQDLNEAHYTNEWASAIDSGYGVILLMEQDGIVAGGIGGMRNKDLLSGTPIAIELFWYVKEQYRSGMWPMRLLSEFERWATESGCESVSMIHMERSMPEHMKKIYSRLGYELIETVHRKGLCVLK